MGVIEWITLLGAMAAIGSVCVGIYQLRSSIQTNKTLKRADVAMHCTLRYEELKRIVSELEQKYAELPPPTRIAKSEVFGEVDKIQLRLWKNYYSRYWALKSDQFDFWLYGLLEHGTFLDWTYSTSLAFWREFHHKRVVRESCPFTFSDSWNTWKKDDHGPVNPHFVRFTDDLFDVVKRSDSNGLQLITVFNAIKQFHGSPASRGVSRRLQSLAWKGVTLENLEKILIDDLKRNHHG